MYNNIIIIFLIMLFGLILCSFLGGNCEQEGFQSNSNSNSSKKSANNGVRNNNIDESTDVNGASTNSFDNYNHYDGSSHASVFYGPDGGTAKIIQNNGKAAISITGPDGQTETFAVDANGNGNNGSVNSYTGPNGATATIAKSDDGKQIIKVTTSNGELVSYSEDSVHVTTTDNMNDIGNNVDVNQYTGPAGNTVTTVSGANGNVAAKKNYNDNYDVVDANDVDVDQYTGPRGNTATSVTGPRGNTATSATGPRGNTALAIDNNYDYEDYLPPGIPKNQIPVGDEDLYILKSQVVPPVCPVCPTANGAFREKKCPACPPCGRCPEPAFDCKKVPNYSAFNSKYMPMPVLTSFSGFGM